MCWESRWGLKKKREVPFPTDCKTFLLPSMPKRPQSTLTPETSVLFYFVFFLFVCLSEVLTMTWNSLCILGWLQTHRKRSTCFCLPTAEIKGVGQTWDFLISFFLNFINNITQSQKLNSDLSKVTRLRCWPYIYVPIPCFHKYDW